MDGLFESILIEYAPKFLLSKIASAYFWFSPAPSNAKPFAMITNNTAELKQMKKAELDPTIVLISDWNHATSEELRDVSVTANIDVLWVQIRFLMATTDCTSAAAPIPFLSTEKAQ